MQNHKFNISNIIIYLLFLILFSIICLNFYKILKLPNEININLSSKKSMDLKNTNNINEIYYNENLLTKIPSIYEADIVYQWFDKSINSLAYSSIAYNKDITDPSISFKNPINVSELPTIKFVDLMTFDKNNFIDGRKNIVLKFPNNQTIQFYFKEGMYHYCEVDNSNSIEMFPIYFTNIVIMKISDYYTEYVFSNKSKINGDGFVLSNGKYKNVIFKDNLIFNSNSYSQVPLLKGNTFWCFLNSDSEIEFFD